MKIKVFKAVQWHCAPCVALTPVITQLAEEKNIPLSFIDVDEEPELTAEMKIRGVPTLIVFDDKGEELGRKVGAVSHTHLSSWLENFE